MGACSPNPDACFHHSMGASGAQQVGESLGLSRGSPVSIPCLTESCFRGCQVGSGEGREVGRSHLNLPCSWAFFRTSSREEPAGTETECLYEGEMLETFSKTSMNFGTWACGGVSGAGSNRAVPGRGEGAATLRVGGQALVLLSSQEDTAAPWLWAPLLAAGSVPPPGDENFPTVVLCHLGSYLLSILRVPHHQGSGLVSL